MTTEGGRGRLKIALLGVLPPPSLSLLLLCYTKNRSIFPPITRRWRFRKKKT